MHQNLAHPPLAAMTLDIKHDTSLMIGLFEWKFGVVAAQSPHTRLYWGLQLGIRLTDKHERRMTAQKVEQYCRSYRNFGGTRSTLLPSDASYHKTLTVTNAQRDQHLHVKDNNEDLVMLNGKWDCPRESLEPRTRE